MRFSTAPALIVWALALTGALPVWLVILPLGWIHFAYYTLVHESIHGNVVRKAGYAWVTACWDGGAPST